MFPGMPANDLFFCNRFGARVTASMIQVHAAATLAHLLGLDAHIHQALSKLSILSAILHALIKGIGSDDMFLPG
jgi:hypothetical protein